MICICFYLFQRCNYCYLLHILDVNNVGSQSPVASGEMREGPGRTYAPLIFLIFMRVASG
jgi:hypothetical protein